MEPSKSSWINYIRKRTLFQNKNFIATITGPTGSGKSWSALSIAEQVDPDFNIDRVVFKAKDLMGLINSDDLKPGSVIIWEEAGVDLSSRNWQSLLNKVINFLLQTFRHKNLVLIFTVPYHDFIDVSSRKLIHAELRTNGINNAKGTCNIKAKLLQYNPELKKWYNKYLKRMNGAGYAKVKSWKVKKPSKGLIDAYEDKKSAFTTSLNQQIVDDINELSRERNGKFMKGEHEMIFNLWHKGMNQKQIAVELDVTPQAISGIMQTMDKKYNGWKFNKEYLENQAIPA